MSLVCRSLRDKLGLCLDHLLYVCQVNEYINLTRITDLDDAIVLHIIDSLLLESYIPDSVERVLDMGTCRISWYSTCCHN